MAGSGDVLAGAIGAQLAAGATPVVAAQIGALAHQHAGQLLTVNAARGWLATDLADALKDVFANNPRNDAQTHAR